MRIERIYEPALDAPTEAGIAALLEVCFAGTYQGRSFYRQRHHLRFVTFCEDRIVGHVALGLRAVRLGKNLLDVGTVGEVATLPEFQRQGIATRLLKAAIREAENSPARFLLLFGKPPLYTRAGFHPATNPMVHVDMLGAVTGEVMREPSTFLMVRPLGAETWGDGVILDLLGPKF